MERTERDVQTVWAKEVDTTWLKLGEWDNGKLFNQLAVGMFGLKANKGRKYTKVRGQDII